MLKEIVETSQKADKHWRVYKDSYGGYVYYTKKLNKLKHTRDGLNFALTLVENSVFDSGVDGGKLGAMEMPVPKKQRSE